MLLGAEEALGRTEALLIEVTFVSHYTGDTMFPWLHSHLTERGFDLVGLSGPHRSASGDIITWADACYARTHSSDRLFP